MADKVSMSLDEIIRASKSKRINEASSGRNTGAKKQGARLSTGRARAAGRPTTFSNSKFNNSKKIVKRAVMGLNQRNFAKRNVNNANTNAGGMIPRAEVKNIVNKAVKQAIKQSNANIGIVGRLGGQIPRNIITASKLAQLSQRSRTIQRTRVVPQMRQRGRGFGAQPVQIVEQLVSPQPVRIIRQPIQAPVVQVVERIVPARQQVRKIGGRGGVIARGQQQIARVGGGGRIVRQAPIAFRQQQVQQRVIQQQRPVARMQRVVVQQQQQQPRFVQQQRVIQRPAQRIVRQPQQQVIYQQRAVPQQQRVQVVRRQAPIQQRVQIVRQAAPRRNQQNVQYVEYAPAPNAARNNKNNRMRDALGLGSPRHVIRETQRFEPSSSFLANRTISNSRGRGFASGRNAY